jgi:hypothetical protein
MFGFKKTDRSTVKVNDDGHEVLTKTADFRLYVIRNHEDDILGTVLLTDAQVDILNQSCKSQGIKFVRR